MATLPPSTGGAPQMLTSPKLKVPQPTTKKNLKYMKMWSFIQLGLVWPGEDHFSPPEEMHFLLHLPHALEFYILF